MSERRSRVIVQRPLLRLDVVLSTGARAEEHRVFCTRRRESVAVGVCASCAHCDWISTTLPAPLVACAEPETAGEPAPELAAVGSLLSRGARVLRDDCSLRDALTAIHETGCHSVAVVDGRRVLIGTLHELSLVPRPSALRAVPVLRRETLVGAVMSSALAVHESTPVRAALRLLAKNHAREATVVTSEGIPLGTFCDVEAMGWLRGSTRGRGPGGP